MLNIMIKHWRESYKHIFSFPTTFWIVIAASLMNQIGNMALVFLILYLNKHLGWSLTESSIAFAAFSGATLLIGIIGGALIDKIGSSRTLILTLVINGFTLLSLPYFTSNTAVILMCLIWGTAFGLYRPASQTFVAELSTPGLHKLTFSVYRLVMNLGMSIGPALGGYLASQSYPAIFYVNGVTNILASIILAVGLLRYAPSLPTSLPKSFEFTLHWLKRDALLTLFLIAMVPISMVFFQCESSFPIFLNENLKTPPSFYGALFTLNTLIIVFFELPLNVAILNWPYRLNFILGSFFITIGFVLLLFASKAWHIIALTIVWTLGEMILFPASSSYIADIAPAEHRGSYMALYSTCSNLGMLLGPLFGTLLMQYLGAPSLWMMCAIWGIISILLFNSIEDPNYK